MKLGLGTVQLGLTYGVANRTGKPDRSETMEILTEAWQAGIDTYDTAAAYGDSEQLIGAFASNRNLRGMIKIATKAGGFAKSCEQSDAVLETSLRQAVENALEKLGVGYIDYFMLHDRGDLRYIDKISGILQSIKADGLVHKWGLSVYTGRDISTCLEHPCRPAVDVIQIPFNILDQRMILDGTLSAMKSRGIEIHARSVYLQGLIAMEPEILPARLQSAGAFLLELEKIAESCGLTRTELAHCYVRDNAAIDRMFVGCETLEQLRSNLSMQALPPLDYEKVLAYAQQFAVIPDNILNPALW